MINGRLTIVCEQEKKREVEWKSRGEFAEVHSGGGLIEYQSLSDKGKLIGKQSTAKYFGG